MRVGHSCPVLNVTPVVRAEDQSCHAQEERQAQQDQGCDENRHQLLVPRVTRLSEIVL